MVEEGYSRSGKELVHENSKRPEVDRSVMALHEDDTTRQCTGDDDNGDDDEDGDDGGGV